jgi:O-antigen ligase
VPLINKRAERWLRAYGPFDHPNILGGVATISLLLLIYFIWTYRGQLKQAERIFVMIATICLSAGLLVSFSRAAWLAFIIGALAYFIFLGEDRKEFITKTLSTKIIMLAVIILFAVPYYYVFVPRFVGTSRLETISTTERLSGDKESLALIAKNPLIGSGLGTYGLALHKEKPNQSVWFYTPVHNTFLLITSELGLIGLALFIWLSVLVFKALGADRERRLAAIALVSSFVILMFFDHWLLSLHFGPILAAATLGLLMKKD